MDEARLRAWLIKVVCNVARTAVRDQTRTRRNVRREEPLDGPDGPPPASLSTPSEALARRERAERVTAAVAGLPDDLRQVVALRAFDDFSWPEVAGRMGLSESAARRLWAKAVEGLKHLLAEES